MTPYLVVFVVSTVFVAAAGSVRNRSVIVRWVGCAIAALLVGALAGMRDYDVGGPDVMLYGNKIFWAMTAAPDLATVFDYASSQQMAGEIGYLLLNWAVSRWSNDPHAFYFVLATLLAAIYLVAILLLRHLGSPVVMWLTYLLTVYVEAYNLLRQSVALALSVLGIALVLRSRYRWALAVGAAGLLFHNSALMFLGLWAAAVYMHRERSRQAGAIAVVIVVTGLGVSGLAPLLEYLSYSLSDTKYAAYLGDQAEAGQALGIDALYRLLPLAVGVVLYRAAVARSTPPTSAVDSLPPGTVARPTGGLALATAVRTDSATTTTTGGGTVQSTARAVLVLLVLAATELVLLPIREISYPFYRLLIYFGYLRILLYGILVRLADRQRYVAAVGSVLFAFAFFYFIVILRNEATYRSAILDQWLLMT